MADAHNRVAVITGAPSGIGFDFAKKLLQRGTFETIFIAARNEQRGAETIQKLKEAVDTARTALVAFPCDNASLVSVRGFAEKVLVTTKRVDLLVLNAGVAAGDGLSKAEKLSAEGIELTFAINHVAHWYLCQLLMPLLRAAGKSRVVVTSSEGHKQGKIPSGGWREIASPGRSTYLQAYFDSKLANVMHAYELQRRFGAEGITATSLHPGAIRETNIWHQQTGCCTRCVIDGLMFPVLRLVGGAQTVAQGGDALLAASDAAEGGAYLQVSKWVPSSPLSRDVKAAQELWALTEALVKEKLLADSRL